MNDTQQLLHYLQAHRIVMASAESCTGGMIADQVTHIAGSSENFWGSWVVYDNTAKIDLGVPLEALRQYGAVSSQTALHLADAGLKRLSTILTRSDPGMIGVIHPWKTLAVVSTTGVAGPAGGTPDKPVGLCYVGVAIGDKAPTFQEIHAPSGLTRTENKTYFARRALEFLFESLRK